MWIYAQVVNAYIWWCYSHLCAALNTLLKETLNPLLKIRVLLAPMLRQHVRVGQALKVAVRSKVNLIAEALSRTPLAPVGQPLIYLSEGHFVFFLFFFVNYIIARVNLKYNEL